MKNQIKYIWVVENNYDLNCFDFPRVKRRKKIEEIKHEKKIQNMEHEK